MSNQLVSNLAADLKAKVSDLERRITQCESAGSEGVQAGMRQLDSGNLKESFYCDFFKLREFMLRHDRIEKRCNAIIRGPMNITVQALSDANTFLETFFDCSNCVSYAKWLGGKRGGSFVTFHNWESRSWISENKRETLKNTEYFIDHDSAQEDIYAAKVIRDVCRQCKDLEWSVKKGFNKIWINRVKHLFDPLTHEFSPPLPSQLAGVCDVEKKRSSESLSRVIGIGNEHSGDISGMDGVEPKVVQSETSETAQQTNLTSSMST